MCIRDRFIVDVPDPRPGALLRAGDRVGLGFAANSVILVALSLIHISEPTRPY